MPRSPSAPSALCAGCAVSSLTAAARKKVTNGVAMPSLSPLSTLRMRRMRARAGPPPPAAVPSVVLGGRDRCRDRGEHPHVDAGEQQPGEHRAEPDAQRQAEEQQARGDRGVAGQHVEVDARRVGEQQQCQRDLGERVERLATRGTRRRHRTGSATGAPSATNTNLGAVDVEARETCGAEPPDLRCSPRGRRRARCRVPPRSSAPDTDEVVDGGDPGHVAQLVLEACST